MDSTGIYKLASIVDPTSDYDINSGKIFTAWSSSLYDGSICSVPYVINTGDLHNLWSGFYKGNVKTYTFRFS